VSETPDRFEVVVGAGSLRPHGGTAFAHRWTDEGVASDAPFTGAHLLHLAVAGCVLNDVYREAGTLGLTVEGVLVRAGGAFDTDTWSSTGIYYSVEIDSPDEVTRLLEVVDEVAEIPKAVRAGAVVRRA